MGGHSGEKDIALGGGQESLRAAYQCARPLGFETDMETEQHIHAVHGSGLRHRESPARTLFGRLEDQAYPPPQVPPDRNKHFSQAKPPGGVPIVSARVHQAGPA